MFVTYLKKLPAGVPEITRPRERDEIDTGRSERGECGGGGWRVEGGGWRSGSTSQHCCVLPGIPLGFILSLFSGFTTVRLILMVSYCRNLQDFTYFCGFVKHFEFPPQREHAS